MSVPGDGASVLFLFHSDCRNLNPGIVDECNRLDGGARRFRVRHEITVNLVHVAELLDIREVHGYGYDVFQLKSGSLDYLLNIIERRLCLGCDPARYQLSLIVCSFLACNVESVARQNSIAERKVPVAGNVDRLVFLGGANRDDCEDRGDNCSRRNCRNKELWPPYLHLRNSDGIDLCSQQLRPGYSPAHMYTTQERKRTTLIVSRRPRPCPGLTFETAVQY